MTPEQALSYWPLTAELHDCPDAGLINRTWLVGAPPGAVLQWLNPIFPARVNLDIALWCERLRSRGLSTPQLLHTRDGELWVEDDAGGCWRMLSFVPGRTVHRLNRVQQAEQAGMLVGRVHRATDGWTPERHAPVRNIHDTRARMAELRAALQGADGHALEVPARALGRRILDRWEAWDGPLDLPPRICHGDLKISNIRFDETGDQAVCLIDLDTVGPMQLTSELGDAWRSWCNPAGEDDPQGVRFDLDLFRASATAFLRVGPTLDRSERLGLASATERICLELAARFCADAVRNDYFREDRDRFPRPGAHNLHRARCQLSLAGLARQRRDRCATILDAAA